MEKITSRIITIIFIAIFLFQSFKDERAVAHTKKSRTTNNSAMVSRVIDGDTIELSTGEKVRYIGINTPETVHPSKAVQCFGEEAAAKNKELVLGKEVILKKDVSNKDKYGRLLRYVYLNDGTMVNNLLVKNGYAFASAYPPDIKYQLTFESSEKEARENNLGLWENICDYTDAK
ncbi:hypothetical protein AUK11_02240 [bacterium CG2_30_37_16]|nr:MAG: hypothetical protein AUK11_02240 [bacterium CG2_30_37_16]PIP31151.1 MAG: hypothetical protein COX25_00740 [bacterium (Candidatus Howlettbacteria) CG23_combo_of_CG06-09_8_20_14_all_37_9]PIY00434.1 MAG: hypothetical protein COZ22_00220 [bacterium (Candidatus Howlettbacteria) CG_4_10_14_3_um_filter_37_10]PJB06504.1 MAG: hypothetical protein CO123_02020 [bacterium (Candidatus Howlettbacteria) CG_4_9_14_3_um_filter_37_10]